MFFLPTLERSSSSRNGIAKSEVFPVPPLATGEARYRKKKLKALKASALKWRDEQQMKLQKLVTTLPGKIVQFILRQD